MADKTSGTTPPERGGEPSSGEVAQVPDGEPSTSVRASGRGAHARGQHSCAGCGISFVNEAAMEQHMREMHGDAMTERDSRTFEGPAPG